MGAGCARKFAGLRRAERPKALNFQTAGERTGGDGDCRTLVEKHKPGRERNPTRNSVGLSEQASTWQ
jgi:hypothetical protein